YSGDDFHRGPHIVQLLIFMNKPIVLFKNIQFETYGRYRALNLPAELFSTMPADVFIRVHPIRQYRNIDRKSCFFKHNQAFGSSVQSGVVTVITNDDSGPMASEQPDVVLCQCGSHTGDTIMYACFPGLDDIGISFE